MPHMDVDGGVVDGGVLDDNRRTFSLRTECLWRWGFSIGTSRLGFRCGSGMEAIPVDEIHPFTEVGVGGEALMFTIS